MGGGGGLGGGGDLAGLVGGGGGLGRGGDLAGLAGLVGGGGGLGLLTRLPEAGLAGGLLANRGSSGVKTGVGVGERVGVGVPGERVGE